jgi:hypothetical protein
MTEIDRDLQQRLKGFVQGIKLEPRTEALVLSRSRTRRRLVAVASSLALLLLLGGITGGMSLLADRGPIEPAPGPHEVSGCVYPTFSVFVLVPDDATDDQVAEVRERISRDERVVEARFVTAEEAETLFREENPGYSRHLPTGDGEDQFRLRLETGVDPDAVADDLREVGEGAVVPAPECPTPSPTKNFARYFFKTARGNASASGILEVDWRRRSICLQADLTPAITASHLEMEDPDRPPGTGRWSVVLSLFEPDESATRQVPSSAGPYCVTGHSLDELIDVELFVRLLDQPEMFRIDFHRGPDDVPGLKAELIPQEGAGRCTRGPIVTRLAPRAQVGWRVGFVGDCWMDATSKQRVFLTTSLNAGGRVMSKTGLTERGAACELVARAQSKIVLRGETRFAGWFVPPERGRCGGRSVVLPPGRYAVAVGCPACVVASVRLRAPTR